MNNKTIRLAAACAVFLLASARASAVCTRAHEGGKIYPWLCDNGSWQEEEMHAAGVRGWYLPVGPTGIRAMITHEQPCYFKVMYVFKNTPAHGKVKAGDVIIGANGMILNKPHNFGKGGGTSYEGPWTTMAPLIEDSQGKDGKLELVVLRGGKEPREKVEVKIPAVGRFSPTFPYDCERSEKLITFLCRYLENEIKTRGKPRGHIYYPCLLALMATGDRQYDSMIRDAANALKDRTPTVMVRGKQSWGHGYEGVFLGEYYLRYRDRSVLPYMQKLSDYYSDGIGYERAAYSHCPRPSIVKDVGSQVGGAGVGYGAMAGPAGLSMLAMSLFKSGGLPYAELAYERIHQAYLSHSRPDCVAVAYGFKGWPSVHVELKNPEEAVSGRGMGYRVPTGMKDVTEYKIIGHSLWCLDEKNKSGWLVEMRRDAGWIESERDTNIVVEWKGARRHIIRAPTLSEPTRPYDTSGGCAQMPVGLGALAHTIGNPQRPSWKYLGVHAGNSCALGYRKWFDGHACGSMHQLWVAMGASRAQKEKFREFMDGVKWWFVMQQAHDGSYMTAPNRDRPSGCNKDGGRGYGLHTAATANAALILAVARRQLQITGAEPPGSSSDSTASGSKEKPKKTRIEVKLPPRPPAATPEGLARFDERLLPRVMEVVKAGKRIQFYYSAMRALVRITDITEDGNVSLRGVRAPVTITSAFSKLSPKDKATIALAVARDGQAADHENAAFFLKAAGRDTDARTLLLQAGDPTVVLSGFAIEPAEK